MRYKERIVKRPALLWKRVVAYLLDFLILLFIVSPLKNFMNSGSSASLFETYEMLVSNTAAVKSFLPITFFIFIVTLLYFSFLEFKLGQTPGKMIMRLHVISAIKKERHFEHFLVRNLSKVSTPILLIDSIPILFSRSSQRYLERFAGTLVIQEEREVKLK